MTPNLTIFCKRFKNLIDECDVVLVDVEPEQPQPAGRRSADDVQQHQRLRHQVVLRLVPLLKSMEKFQRVILCHLNIV